MWDAEPTECIKKHYVIISIRNGLHVFMSSYCWGSECLRTIAFLCIAQTIPGFIVRNQRVLTNVHVSLLIFFYWREGLNVCNDITIHHLTMFRSNGVKQRFRRDLFFFRRDLREDSISEQLIPSNGLPVTLSIHPFRRHRQVAHCNELAERI